MNIIMLGAPGVGKSTQAQFIMEHYGVPHIAMGDILRATIIQRKSDLNKQAKALMDTGKLVTDHIVLSLVKKRIKHDDCYNGFLLDGFPRTIPQADAIKEAGIKIDYVLEFTMPDRFIIDRIVSRRVHASSGRVYNVKFNKPKQEGKDDITGEPLIIRQDDQEDTVRKRLLEYSQQTAPLIDYYRKEAKAHTGNTRYITIDSARNLNDISAELVAILG